MESELISKTSFWGDKIFNTISVFFVSIGKVKKISSLEKLIELVDSIDDEKIINCFDSVVVKLLDDIYSEVFHPLISFDDVSFITKDWKKLQQQLIKRFNEGHRYGAIFLDSNGNIAIGILPKEQQILKPIEDPEKEVYVMINESGIAICSLVSWDKVKDGSAFPIKKKE